MSVYDWNGKDLRVCVEDGSLRRWWYKMSDDEEIKDLIDRDIIAIQYQPKEDGTILTFVVAEGAVTACLVVEASDNVAEVIEFNFVEDEDGWYAFDAATNSLSPSENPR